MYVFMLVAPFSKNCLLILLPVIQNRCAHKIQFKNDGKCYFFM